MTKLTIAFVAALSLFGCKKKGGGDEAVSKMTEFKEAMCKCGEGDADCAKKVTDAQMKYGEEQAKNADKDAKPDPDLAAKMKPLMDEYTKCATKAMTPKAAGGPPPPAEEKKAEAPKAEEKKAEEPKKDEKKDEKKDDKKAEGAGGGW